MRKYEFMFIVRPSIEEAEVKKVAKIFEDELKKDNAKLLDKKEMGQKELAYEIDKHKTGYYFLMQFETASKEVLDEVDRLARINENVIRHMIIKLED